MVKLGTSNGYDGFMEEEHRPQPNGSTGDEGLRAAMRALVESVNATSRQLSEAAESFADEALRAMEGFASQADHSAAESRDMASMAGRAADEARRLSGEATSAVDSAREQARADIESMVGAMRAQLDDALRSTAESVASARVAAEEAQQRGREATDKVDQSLAASREAAAAASAAAEAARRTAEGIDQAVAEARDHVRAELSSVDQESTNRIEQSLAASREAAATAECAAEDARSAALEAMSHAAEARIPASEAGNNPGAQELLDRLEADYQLLTDLVRDLHEQISGLNTSAAAKASGGDPSATLETVAPASPVSGVATDDMATMQPPFHSTGEATTEAVETLTAEGDQETSEPGAAFTTPWSLEASVWNPPAPVEDKPAEVGSDAWTSWRGAEPEVEATPAQDRTAAPEIEWQDQRREMDMAVGAEPEAEQAAARTEHDQTYGSLWPAPSEFGPVAPEEGIRTPAASTAAPAHDYALAGAEVAQEGEPEDEASRPSTWHWQAAKVPAAMPAPEAPIDDQTAADGGATHPADSVDSPPSEEPESEQAPLELWGRVVLNVSPVPDFDRLLSLDGALGRLSFVRNVTLADYAKEAVTFRVELNESIAVDDFTKELAQVGGQALEVVSVAPGELNLKIARSGAQE